MNVRLCVDICVHLCHVRVFCKCVCVLCPAPHRSETELCRHLREHVSLYFLSGCERKENPTLPATTLHTCKIYSRVEQVEVHWQNLHSVTGSADKISHIKVMKSNAQNVQHQKTPTSLNMSNCTAWHNVVKGGADLKYVPLRHYKLSEWFTWCCISNGLSR